MVFDYSPFFNTYVGVVFMDLHGVEFAMPASHYEQVVMEKQNALTGYKVKWKAFQAMDELEGWCSKEKASVLIDMCLLLKAKTVVEIGVYGGKSLVPMAFALRELGNGVVIGIDPWSSAESAVGMDGVNHDFWSKLDHEKIYQGLLDKVNKFGLSGNIMLLRETSESAMPIPDIDILHIDGNHSEETSLLDVYKWVPFVKKGGLIIFDDVNWATTNKATAWLDENCIKFAEFHGDNIWGIWVKP